MSQTYHSAIIINDCTDDNARGRQELRTASLLKLPTSYVGVPSYSSVAASGNLVDMLDAASRQPNVFLVNVAPRHGEAKQFANGTPFGYFFVRNSLVVTTVAESTLGLIRKLGLAESVRVLDIPTITPILRDVGLVSEGQANRLPKTQFRSYNFVPRVAAYLTQIKDELPGEDWALDQISVPENSVWWVDNFGNVKTSVLPQDIDFEAGTKRTVNGKEVTCYERLKDVPSGEAGLIIGSSGIDDQRWLELVVNGVRGTDHFGVGIGDQLDIQ